MRSVPVLIEATTSNLIASAAGVLLGALVGVWYVRRDRRRRRDR